MASRWIRSKHVFLCQSVFHLNSNSAILKVFFKFLKNFDWHFGASHWLEKFTNIGTHLYIWHTLKTFTRLQVTLESCHGKWNLGSSGFSKSSIFNKKGWISHIKLHHIINFLYNITKIILLRGQNIENTSVGMMKIQIFQAFLTLQHPVQYIWDHKLGITAYA